MRRALAAGLALVIGLAACGLAPESVAPSSAPTATSGSDTPVRSYPDGTLPAFLAADGRFTTFLVLLERDEVLLERLLANPDRNFTLFVPTDGAFDELDAASRDALATDADFVTGIVERHFLMRSLHSDEFASAFVFAGVSRRMSRLALVVDGTTIWFGDALVVETDLAVGNGWVHVLDGLNLGPTPERQPIP